MIKLEYLITGTGCCGTVYAARLFNKIGISCGHESVFDYRGLRIAKARLTGLYPIENSVVFQQTINEDEKHLFTNTAVAESSYMAAPYLDQDILKDTLIFHIVRHPVLTIQALCNHHDNFSTNHPKSPWEEFLYHHMPELKDDLPRYDKGALFYLRWNEMIENAKPEFFCRIDDIDDYIYSIFGKKYTNLSKTMNSFRKDDVEHFSIDMLQSKKIKKDLINKAEQYGFSLK